MTIQVSVETTGTLGRKVSVVVPAERIDAKVSSKIQELTKTIKMDGFRIGKVPVSAVKQRYGKAVRDEMIGKELQESLFEAITQENLHPANTPSIDSIKAEQGHDLEYTASFEVYPVITLADFDNLQVEKPLVEITEADINKVLESIRKQHANWEQVERAAILEDKLVIDFKGIKDGEEFKGGSAENFDLVLGSKQFIAGFEDGLVGTKAGDEKTLELTFPQDYHVKELAGSAVTFEVKVKTVFAPNLPEINEDFAKKMGIKDGSLETFHKQLKENMLREQEHAISNHIKKQIFDQLLEQNKFEVPNALVEHEAQTMIQQRLGKQIAAEHMPKPLPEVLMTEAKRRVNLGLILAEIIKKNDMKADQNKVRAHIEKMAKAYQDPERFAAWYYGNKDHLASVEAVALEDQVVEKILEKAAVTEKSSSYNELMHPTQTENQ